ncbi:hypothetical protein [Pedosphaera parvula]|uniref:Uncharacterized protein n=1 Tax=Pedosphaera parvula (strain Ellin514) TaxID=320771 RepID=B9XGL4_PEDPL|nr:hypothetical protein [Pedosphaera parvula]EEF61065.1 hypothetical protein Cflav_PD3782 [Pedosphaera parvula Ellin514]
MNRWPKLVLTVLITLFAACFMLRLRGYDPLWPLLPAWSQSLQSGNLKSAIHSGLTHDRPYIIESATVLIDMEDLPQEKPVSRTTTFRYVYTIRALRKVAASDNSFTESLHNHFGKKLEYFQGSNPQQPISLKNNEITFNVELNAEKGDVYTIITGMRITEDLPLQDRTLRGFHFAPNAYAAVYPNDEDYIAQVTLLLSSATTRIKATNNAVWRKINADAIPIFSAPQPTPGGQGSYATTLCARFSNLKPGEIVGLNYYW